MDYKELLAEIERDITDLERIRTYVLGKINGGTPEPVRDKKTDPVKGKKTKRAYRRDTGPDYENWEKNVREINERDKTQKKPRRIIYAVAKVLDQADGPMRGRDVTTELVKRGFKHDGSGDLDKAVSVVLAQNKGRYFDKTDTGYILIESAKPDIGLGV